MLNRQVVKTIQAMNSGKCSSRRTTVTASGICSAFILTTWKALSSFTLLQAKQHYMVEIRHDKEDIILLLEVNILISWSQCIFMIQIYERIRARPASNRLPAQGPDMHHKAKIDGKQGDRPRRADWTGITIKSIQTLYWRKIVVRRDGHRAEKRFFFFKYGPAY